jgi:outer membrane protein assembly factor BamA
MKKIVLTLLACVVIISVSAQDKQPKTGWNFGGALPAVTFDTDLGLQYGALVKFFNYGNPSVFPNFNDHIYLEASRFTKGSGIFRFMYESNNLIRNVHFTTDLSYLPDMASSFYGFNGYESVFNKNWTDDKHETYRTRMFYKYERNQFRFKNDFQGKFFGEHLKWAGGFAFQKFEPNSVDIDKLNKGKDDKLPSVEEMPGLYERYQALDIISADEAKGGWVNTLKAGLMYDARDNKPNPMKGLWTEAGSEAAPSFMGNDWSFSKLYFIHRQYFTLIENDLSFVYRLGYQTNLSGKTPFFYQSQVITSLLTRAKSEGLGGATTLRGILMNRVVGDGFVLGNFELRWKPVYFRFLKQDCYLGVNMFYDMGMITQKIEMPDNLEANFATLYPTENFSDFFNSGSEKLHQSAGISIMPVMNQNFVIAIDIGKAFNKQDGNIGFSIGLNYLF